MAVCGSADRKRKHTGQQRRPLGWVGKLERNSAVAVRVGRTTAASLDADLRGQPGVDKSLQVVERDRAMHALVCGDLVDRPVTAGTTAHEIGDAPPRRVEEDPGESAFIADLLSGANPNWPKADVVDLLGQHLALTKNETVARLQQNWDADVEAFDQILTEILTVADVLTSGLIKQFPQRFDERSGKSEKATSLQLALGRLWSDHVLWTRQYILSAVADSPDTGAAAGRLLKNQEDIGAAVGSVYGDAAGKATTDLLKQHIMIAVDIVDAAKKHNDAGFKQANDNWDRNAEAIAALLSSANPNWPTADVTDLLMQHLNLTRRELTSHMGHEHEDDVEAMDLILTEILTVADVLATGIVKQFPDRF
jgi:hypothetical protein